MPLATRKTKNTVGLEVEAGSVAATEVRANGRVEVVGHGVAALAPGVFREGEVTDVEALAAALKDLFAEHKLSKNVRLGIGNQRVVVRTMNLPEIENAGELRTAIRFQAQDQIPMPLDQAVLDWEVIGHRIGPSGEKRIEIVVVAARRDMVAALTEAMTKAGLRAVGIDLSAFGMIRALSTAQTIDVAAGPRASEGEDAPDAPLPARLYCHLGDVVNLAVAQCSSCLFTRVVAVRDRGHRPAALRAAPADPRARAAVARPRRSRRPRSPRSRASPSSSARPGPCSPRARRSSSTSFASRSSTTEPRTTPSPSRTSSPAAPAP